MVVTELRAACRAVAERARHVRLRPAPIALYAASLPAPPPAAPRRRLDPAEREATAWYWLTMDAINFGSGWFPTLIKPPGRSGYGTVSRALRLRFEEHGPWSAAALAFLDARTLADVFGQDHGHPLMARFAVALNDLGERLVSEWDGDPLELIDAAGPSAVALVDRLRAWACFADESRYEELRLPFLKRAQILAADLHRAGVAAFADLPRLTMFADNLVPHVLRLDGILEFEPGLVARIEAGELIEHDSREEIEIRACAVDAVERIVTALPAPGATAAQVDQLLWQRGQGPAYKARPRHRSRTTAY